METTFDTTTRRGFVRVAGQLCLVGAAVGVLGGLVTAFITPAVSIDRYSYPFTPTAHVLAELSYILNHLLLLVGVIGVARSGAAGHARLGRAGVWIAVGGLALLTLCEVGSIALVNSPLRTPLADTVGAGYGVASILTGVGLILTGIAVVRTGRWTGWARYVVLVCGLAVFVLVLPGVFGPFLAGRLVLIAWMLMFAALGLALVRSSRPA